MTDSSDFLPHFITEPIYVIAGEEQPQTAVEPVAPEVTSTTAEEDSSPQVVEEPQEAIIIKPIPTEGQNLKGCVIFVESSEPILDTASKEFLYKVLSSVKRGENDVLIANIADVEADSIEALLAEQNHKQVLCFGSNKFDKLKGETLYSPKQDGHKTYLCCDSLTAIAQDVEKKKALWKALQSIFLG